MHIAIFLWKLGGMKGTAEMKLDGRTVESEFGICRQTIGRALRHLAAAGLIEYDAHRGRKPRIVLLAVSAQ